LAFHHAEMRMIRWMCGAKLRDKLSCVELRQRLGTEDIAKVVQRNRLRWYGPVLRKDDTDKEVGPGKHGKGLWTKI